MLLTTTSHIQGREIEIYYGIVSGETIIGANIFKDFLAGITDIIGGRSGSYERVLKEAKEEAQMERGYLSWVSLVLIFLLEDTISTASLNTFL